MGYNDISAALNRGFDVSNLYEVAQLSFNLCHSDTSLRHPSAAYIIGATAQKIAMYCEGQHVREDTVAVIEAHLKPKLEAVISVAELDADTLIRALDDLARAYADAEPFLESIGRD